MIRSVKRVKHLHTQLENVHWISVQVQIGDPIVAQPGESFKKMIGLFRHASHYLDTCSWKVWRKSIEDNWQKWCVAQVTKNNASATHFFALSQKPTSR